MKIRGRSITAGYQKALLFLTAILAGTVIYLVAQRTASGKSPVVPIRPPMRKPGYILRPLSPGTIPDYSNPQERAALEDFLKWIDSLKNDSSGRRIYDTIRRTRPGLLDSAASAIEYNSLLKLLK